MWCRRSKYNGLCGAGGPSITRASLSVVPAPKLAVIMTPALTLALAEYVDCLAGRYPCFVMTSLVISIVLAFLSLLAMALWLGLGLGLGLYYDQV